ncbi:unnamed protein product [Porites evermanni]|uniref:G-protein coupled receptors family 1 profile domain-containing protein n=1 Tax=Porites evermanni TaxID=104178 RepID=A0ABN8SDA9_9CNID|nr:unnamed protein product [Porites evermanni]
MQSSRIPNETQARKSVHLNKTLLLITTIFVLSWLPFQVLAAVLNFCISCRRLNKTLIILLYVIKLLLLIRFVVSAAGDFVYAKFSEINVIIFLLFSPSSVMILLAFLSCFLVFFFVKDQIASFQLKQIIFAGSTISSSKGLGRLLLFNFFSFLFPAASWPDVKQNISSLCVYAISIATPWILSLIVTFVPVFPFITHIQASSVIIISLSTPLLITCISYCIIWRKQSSRIPNETQARKNVHLNKTLLLITTIFVLSWLPFQVLAAVLNFCISCRRLNKTLIILLYVIKLLHYSNSFMNFLVYCFRMSDYRKALSRILAFADLLVGLIPVPLFIMIQANLLLHTAYWVYLCVDIIIYGLKLGLHPDGYFPRKTTRYCSASSPSTTHLTQLCDCHSNPMDLLPYCVVILFALSFFRYNLPSVQLCDNY